MRYLAYTLQRSNYQVVCPSYWTWRKSPEDIEARLSELLRENSQLQGSKGRRVHFVCHSLGGILLLNLMNRQNGSDDDSQLFDASLGRIVLIASPVNGSSIAAKLKGTVLGHLLVGESLAQALATPSVIATHVVNSLGIISGTEGRGLVGWVAHWLFGSLGIGDGLVATRETAVHGAEACSFPYSHGRLLFSRQVADQVLQFIGSGAFRGEKKFQQG